jgi:hypothetical protein
VDAAVTSGPSVVDAAVLHCPAFAAQWPLNSSAVISSAEHSWTVGEDVGLRVGETVGPAVVGLDVGLMVGPAVVGLLVGSPVVGLSVGAAVGLVVGEAVGAVGVAVGVAVGKGVGMWVQPAH